MANPQAYITVRKSRLQTDNSTVYLEKDVEFEIELYNPTSDKIAAAITINSDRQSSKLVLRPGEKIYLERYFDDARKFKFDTYFVDGSAETQKAIEDNGGLKVQFYRERKSQPRPNVLRSMSKGISGQSTGNIDYYNHKLGLNDFGGDVNMYNSNTSIGGYVNHTSTDSAGIFGTLFSQELSREIDISASNATMDFVPQVETPAPIETGRVEKGSVSDQTFDSVYMDLEYSPFHTIAIKLLPLSQKPQEIALYCTECGRRARNKEKFCPKCGTEINRNF